MAKDSGIAWPQLSPKPIATARRIMPILNGRDDCDVVLDQEKWSPESLRWAR